VSLTSPASGSTHSAGSTITVSASASDSDGTVARVDVYAYSTLIGSDATSPYSINWTNVPAGSYTLVAVAYDNAGGITSSATRTIAITSGPMTSTAIFAPSADHSTVTNYLFDIFPAGADPNTANPVASSDLGRPSVVNGECSANVSQVIQGLAPGNYIATVVAVSGGGMSRSTPSSFTRP
jgi:chitinase